jgi:tripartite-type tricarboxylate transporter receptor subunit TctC
MWGQQVVVDNRSGAGGTLGAGIGARAAPDGYTLFQCNIASNAIAASLYAKLPYDVLRDFAPVSRIGTTASALVVHPSMPFATVTEFIAYAKANPGKLSYGSSGAGTSPHLAMELFKTMAKIDVVHIAYKGAAPALADLIAGQVPVSVSNIPAVLAPIQSGRMRALAVTGALRASQLPAVPTMIEAGLPGYEVTSWYGVCAPAATPEKVLDKLHADLMRVLEAPDVQQRLKDLVVDVAPTSRADFAAFIRAETTRWAQVVKDAGLAPQ